MYKFIYVYMDKLFLIPSDFTLKNKHNMKKLFYFSFYYIYILFIFVCVIIYGFLPRLKKDRSFFAFYYQKQIYTGPPIYADYPFHAFFFTRKKTA